MVDRWGWDDEELAQEQCEHLIEFGRRRKFDGGRCPVLCEACSMIVGWWELDPETPDATVFNGPFLVHEYMCLDPDHVGCHGGTIEYLLGPGDQFSNRQISGQTSLEDL